MLTELTRAGTVLVTGGLGFVGRNLTALLRERGETVVVTDVAGPSTVAAADRASYRQADLRDPDQARAVVAGADLVYHLAGNPSGTLSVRRPLLDFAINAQGTANVCAAAAETGVRRLVYLSTAMVYGRPLAVPMPETHPTTPFLPYGASKLAGEHVVRSFGETFGVETVIGRAFTLYGPGEDPRTAGGEVSQYLRWHLNGLPVRAVGDADRKTRDFTHVHDLVRALHVLAAEGVPGEAYNLGTGVECSLRRLTETISAATGRPVDLVEDPGISEDTYRHVPDVTKLRALGFTPATTLSEGISALAGHLGAAPELPSVPTIFKPAQPVAG